MSKEQQKKSPPSVTTLDEIRSRATQVIPIPAWDGGEIYVRVKRLSLYDMVTAGEIPNELLGEAWALIEAKPGENPMANVDREQKLRYLELFKLVAERTLVEPTYQELEEAGGVVTDEQRSVLFLYAMRGARALELFRNELRTDAPRRRRRQSVGQSTE